MAHPQPGNQNGIVPQQYGVGGGGGGGGQQAYPQAGAPTPTHDNMRPFTLNEALPYTPFTSVLPFESDILSNPTIGSGPLAPSVASLVARDDYDALNKEAENPTQSRRLDGSLEFLSSLLKAEKITQFQFKTAPKATSPPEKPLPSLTDGISPFAKMIYDNTAIAFRYHTPGTPKASTPSDPAMPPRSLKNSPKARRQDPPKVVKHNPASANVQAVAHNKARIEIHIPTLKERNAALAVASQQNTPPKRSSSMSATPTPQPQQPQTVSLADLVVTPQPPPMPLPASRPPPVAQPQHESIQPAQAIPQQLDSTPLKEVKEQPESPKPLQLVPQAPTSPLPASQKSGFISIELPPNRFNKEEFAVVDDTPDAPTHLSEKKKQKAHSVIDDPLGGDLNQRERANVVFSDLRRCFQEIFTAEDQMLSQPGGMSHLIVLTSEQELTMTATAHDKAQKQIKRAIEVGCFRQAPVDDLLRIQSLSEGSMKHADALDFKIDESWGETEVGFWVHQLADIDAGLRAARTSLRIMCGGREEKQLYSEDLIQLGLNLFRNVMEGIVVPMAELRSSGPTANLFRHLSVHKKAISTLFTCSQRLFALMSDLIGSIDLSETVVNTLEFLASRLIFVENAYTEKDSVIGVQKFDGLRLVAMNMLSQIFLMNPSQREGILSEILTSLEKLPVGKQSARQFKLADGGSIQPVSALMMRLIQASAGKVDDQKEKDHGRLMQYLEDENHGPVNGANGSVELRYTIKTEDHAASQPLTAVQELQDLAQGLFDGAYRYAHYVVNFIVKRALKSTKSGDTPYRNLLDLFVEDFTTCLDSPDWPAAELLLRITMLLMFQQVDGEKNSAPARNMALELLGVMAAAISRLRSHVRKTASNFEGSDSDELGRWLADLSLFVLDSNVPVERILRWEGPYRIVVEFLQSRLTDDEHLKSAIAYTITDWGTQIAPGYDTCTDDDSEEWRAELGRTAFRLRNMIEDPRWLSREWSFKSVVTNHAKLSHSITLLRSSFCAAFRNILNVLMGSMTTDQATVRSRSLKSINQVLETDPTILDGDSVVIELVLRCSSDSSPQVRDSALGLIGKCIAMRPKLEEGMTQTVIERFVDSGVGVRKRAMKLAKDIYLRNENKTIRSIIAHGLLHRMQDPDEGVRELARQMIEEIWIAPFYKDDDSVAFKQSLTDHVALMVQTAKRGNTALILDKVFQTILSPESRLADANTRVCTRLVANMFDLVDNPDTDDPSIPSGKDALQVLMIFAKADPKLFTFEQIRLLKPRISSVSTSKDMAISRAVIVIYRRVLPQVSSVHSQFLIDVRQDLLKATGSIPRPLVDDAIACIWIISGLLKTSENIARLVSSSLVGIQKARASLTKAPLSPKQVQQFNRYSLIVGMAGKHCNFDNDIQLFKSRIPEWKGDSVSKLMVDIILPFTDPAQPEDVRKPALDAVGLVCQSNPRNYVAPNVWKAFEKVFEEQNPGLEAMILRSFKEFLFTEEQRSEQSANSAGAGKETGKKDLKVMGGTSFDDVASATTQRFLKDITRIALATQDDHAFLAMEVLASINRQGLVHPKETGITLMTLETCPVTRISELAYHEHRALHEKYESVLEREYTKAMQSAFKYQQDVIHDTRGAIEATFTPKFHLLIEVLKISKSKNRVRFLEKFVGQIDFDPSKLEVDQPMPTHVAFCRFLIENLAFFEYVTVGELQTTVTAMEKLVTGTGSSIAQAIESEIFQVRMDPVPAPQQPVEGEPQPAVPAPAPSLASSVDPLRLRRLAAGSTIFLALWEARSYLRRLFGLNPNRRETKGKATAKDHTKPPVRVQGVTGDKFWADMTTIMSRLDTPENMLEQCRLLVELLNVDSEVKIADEDEDLDAEGEPSTPDAEEDDDEGTIDGRGRKRKAISTPGGRKKRPRSSSKPRPRGRPRKQSMETQEIDMQDDESWI
ncbi:sister chromatid cohesion protein Mis4 [Biscogniauxia mediterranea]|nr:sister chromatid cohesion protein Mis4 [Biscogniauxia mediterranea]